MELLSEKGNEQVGFEIMSMMNDIIKFRKDEKLAEKCVRNYKLRKNEHWKHKDPALKLTSVNLLGRHHQSTVNMLTSNSPTFNAVQIGDIPEEAADMMQILVNTTDTWWTDAEQQQAFVKSVDMGEQNGTVGEFLAFNPKLNFPEGEIETTSLDILYYSLYPAECAEVEKAEAFLRWYPKTINEIKREYPETGAEVVPDSSIVADIQDTRHDHNATNATLTQVVIDGVTKFLTKSSSTADQNNTVFVIECWVKDYSQDEEGNPIYPGNIRRVQICNAGKIVLDDSYNPSLNSTLPDEVNQKQYLYNRFPVSHTQSVTDPYSPFGLSDFDQLEKLNFEVNKAITQIVEFKDRTARAKIKNPLNSGVPNDQLTNTDSIINPTNEMVSRGIEFMAPPPIAQDLITSVEMFKGFFDDVAGTFNNVLQGQQPGSSVVAYKAIAALLEESGRMVKGKNLNYHRMLRERGRMFLSLSQAFGATRYVTFQKGGQKQTKIVTAEMLRSIPGKITIVNGSTMPRSLVQKREEALTLAQGGFIDQKAVLKAYGYNNAEEIIDRMQAGVFGKLFELMKEIGVPDQVLQLFQELTKMDKTQIQKAIQSGQLPSFMQLMQQLMQGNQQPNYEAMKIELELQKQQIEIQKEQAEIARIEADANEKQSVINKNQAQQEYYLAQAQSEYVDQTIKQQGVEFDKEKLKIMRAETIANIKKQEKEVTRNVDFENGQGVYQERGLQSNNMVQE